MATIFWLLAMPAFALGLGQIEVKSRPGQPLLAEIPIVSSDPEELQGLTARLASPDTFRRIGLEPPQGVVTGLRFEPALDASGRPIIRVTSNEPVDEPALVFLLEVDWGQGRLVREYTALVDAPRSVAAPVQAPVQAPTPVPDGLIERPATVATQPEPQPPTEPQPPVEQEPAEGERETAAAPAPAPVPAPAQPAPATPSPEPPQAPDARTVQSGDTLSEIASELPGFGGYSLDQAMLALLHANPDAFIGEDINRLRSGAVLRMPSADDLSRHDASEASRIVREQVAAWRQSRRPPVQPAAAGSGSQVADAGEAEAPAPRTADARLEIAPPQGSEANQAGTQSGASAGGEGDMLRQELQQTRESLAARDAEVAELKARVAELEQLQKQQQDLITMKDSALASAQQRLEQGGAAPDAAAAASAQAFAWWWILPLVLVLAALAWWLSRRRSRAEASVARERPRVSDAYARQAGASASASRTADGDAAQAAAPEPAASEVAEADAGSTPHWVGKSKASPAAKATSPAEVGDSPTWMAGAPAADAVAPLNQAPAGRDRIELARAYVELGDKATARSLLQEVIGSGDPQAREEAERALQQLG